MMDDYYSHRRQAQNYMRYNGQTIDPQGHATDLFTRWASDFIRRSTRGDRPFFLYLAYNAPHTPIQPPESWLRKVKEREKGISDKRAKLVALIEHLDSGIGTVLDSLTETGQVKNTLVIFTSDNGGQLSVGANNGPLRDGKQSMYEGGIRVPACAVWPGRIQPATRATGNWMTMDIFATACEAAGVEIEQPIEGRSFLPMVLGRSSVPPERDMFFHRREGGLRYGGLTTEAVRRGDWKLLRNSPYAPPELYNMKTDPRETENILQSQRRIAGELSAALRQQNQRGGAVPWQPPSARDAATFQPE